MKRQNVIFVFLELNAPPHRDEGSLSQTNTSARARREKASATCSVEPQRRKLPSAPNEGKPAREGVNQSGNHTLAKPL